MKLITILLLEGNSLYFDVSMSIPLQVYCGEGFFFFTFYSLNKLFTIIYTTIKKV